MGAFPEHEQPYTMFTVYIDYLKGCYRRASIRPAEEINRMVDDAVKYFTEQERRELYGLPWEYYKAIGEKVQQRMDEQVIGEHKTLADKL